MTLPILLSLISYMFIMTYTPGPANILSLNISSNYGFKKFLPVLAGLFSGFLFDMSCCAVLNFGFQSLLPQVTRVLTYVGAAYILWLAIHIFRSKPSSEDSSEQKPSFLLGFFLQMSNVKIILYGLTIFSTYVTPYFKDVAHTLLFVLLLPAVGASSCVLWAFFGKLLTKFVHKYYRICNTVMALTLLWCVYEILFA